MALVYAPTFSMEMNQVQANIHGSMPRTGLQTSSNYFSPGCPFNTPSAKALKGGFFFLVQADLCKRTADHRHF